MNANTYLIRVGSNEWLVNTAQDLNAISGALHGFMQSGGATPDTSAILTALQRLGTVTQVPATGTDIQIFNVDVDASRLSGPIQGFVSKAA